MPIFHAIVLGIVQGLSEYLPISSSGHLILVPWIFKWDDFGGSIALAKSFDVALHLGTLIGAVVYFRKDIVRLGKAGLSPSQRGTQDFRLAWMLLLSAVPAAITGALFKDTIEAHTSSIPQIAIMLIVFGAVLYWADQQRGARDVDAFRLRDAVVMGTAQALALQPGVSRSGVTISAGRKLGFDRDSAARLGEISVIWDEREDQIFRIIDSAQGRGHLAVVEPPSIDEPVFELTPAALEYLEAHRDAG